jgi:hypothetical protein
VTNEQLLLNRNDSKSKKPDKKDDNIDTYCGKGDIIRRVVCIANLMDDIE